MVKWLARTAMDLTLLAVAPALSIRGSYDSVTTTLYQCPMSSTPYALNAALRLRQEFTFPENHCQMRLLQTNNGKSPRVQQSIMNCADYRDFTALAI